MSTDADTRTTTTTTPGRVGDSPLRPDGTPDGQRFVFSRRVDVPPSPPSPMILVENWIEELKRMAPQSK